MLNQGKNLVMIVTIAGTLDFCWYHMCHFRCCDGEKVLFAFLTITGTIDNTCGILDVESEEKT